MVKERDFGLRSNYQYTKQNMKSIQIFDDLNVTHRILYNSPKITLQFTKTKLWSIWRNCANRKLRKMLYLGGLMTKFINWSIILSNTTQAAASKWMNHAPPIVQTDALFRLSIQVKMVLCSISKTELKLTVSLSYILVSIMWIYEHCLNSDTNNINRKPPTSNFGNTNLNLGTNIIHFKVRNYRKFKSLTPPTSLIPYPSIT